MKKLYFLTILIIFITPLTVSAGFLPAFFVNAGERQLFYWFLLLMLGVLCLSVILFLIYEKRKRMELYMSDYWRLIIRSTLVFLPGMFLILVMGYLVIFYF